MLKNYFSVLGYKLVWLNLILIIVSAALAFEIETLSPAVFLLASNFFDILGYHITLIRKSDKLPDKETTAAYRINQFIFDLVLLILIGVLFGWLFSLAGVVLKLFGLQDILYYVFLRKAFPKEWHWLYFTPLGIIKKRLTLTEVLLQGLAGIIFSIIIIFYT